MYTEYKHAYQDMFTVYEDVCCDMYWYVLLFTEVCRQKQSHNLYPFYDNKRKIIKKRLEQRLINQKASNTPYPSFENMFPLLCHAVVTMLLFCPPAVVGIKWLTFAIFPVLFAILWVVFSTGRVWLSFSSVCSVRYLCWIKGHWFSIWSKKRWHMMIPGS